MPTPAQKEIIHIGNPEECFDKEEDREAWRQGFDNAETDPRLSILLMDAPRSAGLWE